MTQNLTAYKEVGTATMLVVRDFEGVQASASQKRRYHTAGNCKTSMVAPAGLRIHGRNSPVVGTSVIEECNAHGSRTRAKEGLENGTLPTIYSSNTLK